MAGQDAASKPGADTPNLKAPRRRIEPLRHLVLVNQPGWQAIEDLYQIAAKVSWIDPTIRSFVVAADINNSVSRRAAATKPTLVVSFGPMGKFKPSRGKVYQGHTIAKFEQLRRLSAAGVPVPRTAYLTPEINLDPKLWGEFVILKPSDIASSSHGLGIQVIRTSRVRYKAPQEYPSDHPGRRGPMIIQQFVNTGPQLEGFRVLTLFGQPLYCVRSLAQTPRVDLAAADDATIETSPITIQALSYEDRSRTYLYDADVIAAARGAAQAIPEVPLQGCDVMRDHRSGRVFVLELNPGGNTWHFSSNYYADTRRRDTPEMNRERAEQLDALNSAAHVLVERTRSEAQ